jgi:ribosomal protein S18 acetylase RimI-like enzyme
VTAPIKIQKVDPNAYRAVFLHLHEIEPNHSPEHPERVIDEGRCELRMALQGETVLGGILTTISSSEIDRVLIGHVENLMVAQSWRGRGLGRELMMVAEDAFRDGGVSVMQLSADADNHIALALYSSLGFVEISRYQRIRSGVVTDRRRMRKQLR